MGKRSSLGAFDYGSLTLMGVEISESNGCPIIKKIIRDICSLRAQFAVISN